MNTVVLIGRLTADPELKHTQNDNAVTSFSIAVDRPYQKAGEERQADFIDIVAWRGTAEFICKYFKKGRKIAVQGVIQTRSYTDKDGNKRKAFEVLAEKVDFADSKQEKQGSADVQYTPESEGFEEIMDDGDLPFN